MDERTDYSWSVPFGVFDWIAVSQRGAGLLGGALSINARAGRIVFTFPGIRALAQHRHARDWTRQAEALEDASLDLGHVETTGVLGGDVNIAPSSRRS